MSSTINDLRARLESAIHQRLYRDSMASIDGRLEPDGYFQESLTGQYTGMFVRTVGPLSFLLLETGRADQARRHIEYCLQSIADNNLERVPHVLNRRNSGKIPALSTRDQVDGQAHVILAWARLALSRTQADAFENNTYALVATLMDRTTDEPHVMLPRDPVPGKLNGIMTGLVRNPCFEHSRDTHYWDTSDLLTQSFVLAALEEMILVAQRRGDAAHAALWQNRMERIAESVSFRLTRDLDGRKAYLEMRLPDGYRGAPYEGMSWLMWSPSAAGWRGVDHEIMQNTIESYRQRATFMWKEHGIVDAEWWPGSPHMIIGKALGWEMMYCLEAGNIARVCECLDFIAEVNTPSLYIEFGTLQNDGTWKLTDPGNGEQCVWMSRAIHRLRKAAGLPE